MSADTRTRPHRGSHRFRYRAFISYAHRYKPWVRALHGHLEACLKHLGYENDEVYLDQVDLGGARSWIDQLQAGVAQAERLVLIGTPESLASPRVKDEWGSFVSANRDWLGRLVMVRLVEAPLPPFLQQVQLVDFAGHDATSYGDFLRELLGALLGHETKRDLPVLPSGGIEPPPYPALSLPPALRGRFIDWLGPVLEDKRSRKFVAAELGLDKDALERQPTVACAASAALVFHTGVDNPLSGAIRVANILLTELDPEDDLETLRGIVADLRAEREMHDGSENDLLSIYLRQVASDHERLVPYFDQAELTLLDRVYVPLAVGACLDPSELASGGEDWTDPRGRLVGSDGLLTLETLISADRGQHPWITGRFVVRGDPGAGKTTLLRYLARSLATDPTRRWVPVFASLPAWMREPMPLLDRLSRQLTRSGQSAAGLDQLLDNLGRSGKLLLLLDGLDEVPREARDDAERFIREQAQRWPEAPMVVTSRPIGYVNPAPGQFRDLDLLPLEQEQRIAFLGKWFGRTDGSCDAARAQAAVHHLDGEPGLLHLSRNPLYLTLMGLLLEEGEDPQPRRTRLYDQVFGLLLAGKHRRREGDAIAAAKTVHEVLRHLAHGMTVDNRDAEPVADIEDRLYKKELDAARGKLERVRGWREGLSHFLKDVGEKTGILGPHDGEHEDWRFWHRTFREALAAEFLETIYESAGKDGVLAHARTMVQEGEESLWAEPFALLAGRIASPDALILSLVESHRDLGLRALATAQGLKPETFRTVLDLADNDWQARAKLYGEIPGLVKDPNRAVALLDTLRQNTRDGNDLYFLHAALAHLRGSEAATEARAALDRFFDHMPLAEADRALFEAVETHDQGVVPLFVPIEAGSFTMGDDEGHFGWGKPAHRVEIVAGFEMACVSVTNAQYHLFDPFHMTVAWPGMKDCALATHPVSNVSWFAAVTFCDWLSHVLLGNCVVRLPSEEEWEYACRADTNTEYCSGNGEKNLNHVGWYAKNSKGQTHRVAQKQPNRWELYDMHGNVWEWTAAVFDKDAYAKRQEKFEHVPTTYQVPADTAGIADPTRGAPRVLRGGSYRNSSDRAPSAHRDWILPGYEDLILGFRVVRTSQCSVA